MIGEGKMPHQTNKTIGVLGGMGPEATALFFQRIIQYTPVNKDQDHIRIIIYNDPKIPDRTKAILDKKDSLIAKAKKGLVFLDRSNVDFIAIPCVTIHYFIDEISKLVNVPILNIARETASYIKRNYLGVRRIGILATTGTIKGQIFEKVFHPENLQTIIPDDKGQEILMESIYGKGGIKAGVTIGYPKKQIIRIANDLIRKGAEIIVGGCTEIPIVLGQRDIKVPFVDSLIVLAKSAIIKAGLTPKL